MVLTPLLQLQHFCCKFPKILFFTYLPGMEFFKIWSKPLKFDSLHNYQYLISKIGKWNPKIHAFFTFVQYCRKAFSGLKIESARRVLHVHNFVHKNKMYQNNFDLKNIKDFFWYPGYNYLRRGKIRSVTLKILNN